MNKYLVLFAVLAVVLGLALAQDLQGAEQYYGYGGYGHRHHHHHRPYGYGGAYGGYGYPAYGAGYGYGYGYPGISFGVSFGRK